ncbi:hypothetical protein QE422_002923 [Chryseobacterium sp. SORGH_AS 447]|uniref:DMP19 family protein n=1 Tax=Chryseobacterium sp. SORGH_AS_0447 TaxID=3041769 RepID=UPI0027884F53|nr:DUF4375 domain-containing protein [Chryseobacterium sp. SORGH_AS_0447]MDQ1162555.1 hypothetical protein [Chryseobacterium sp. SORGH_AS_0447]
MLSNRTLIEKYYLQSTKDLKDDWFDSDMPYWYSHIVNLPKHLQATYLTVLVESQVFNGGFDQYFVNGYGQFAKETIDALIEIGAFKKSNLLENAFNLVKDDNLSDEEFRKQLLNKNLKRLFREDILDEPLRKLDDIYYNIEDENVEDLLADYLKKLPFK